MPTVFVTGANRGLGYEHVKQYAEKGWKVIACARNPEQAKELKAKNIIVSSKFHFLKLKQKIKKLKKKYFIIDFANKNDFAKEKRRSENINELTSKKINSPTSKEKLKNATEAQLISLKNYANSQYQKVRDLEFYIREEGGNKQRGKKKYEDAKKAASQKVSGAIDLVKFLNDNKIKNNVSSKNIHFISRLFSRNSKQRYLWKSNWEKFVELGCNQY